MTDKIKTAFDHVHADETLKEDTAAFILSHTPQRKPVYRRAIVAVAACVVLAVIGSCALYFIPTADITIEINPSVELTLNMFDKVIAATGRNDDGRALVNAVNVRFCEYDDAVTRLMNEETVAALLTDNVDMTITVIGHNDKQTARLYDGIKGCTGDRQNTYCYHAEKHDVDQAHHLQLSYGKYNALLMLQAFDPTITADDIRGMSMRNIREWLEKLSEDEPSMSQTDCTQETTVHHSERPGHYQGGNGRHNGKGNGNGNGNGNKQ